ncbi:MAG: hypothetical protein GTO63_36270, partial [Anaerolineae bacterium]|nr:hypothetical protein [Anaerolineae bacterium]NIO00210.1 hypothetical protein [Anaerolineae bacterium]NIQ82982.1 hypothetical protein [Anaerolineae bacterium]
MQDSVEQGRFEVECERWARTTLSAHQVLQVLVDSREPVTKGSLVNRFDEARTSIALHLLERGGWARRGDEAPHAEWRQTWQATDKGKQHLAAPRKEEKGITGLLRAW